MVVDSHNGSLVTVTVSISVHHVCAGAYGSRRGAEFPVTRVAGGCESPDKGFGNQTEVLWENRKHS